MAWAKNSSDSNVLSDLPDLRVTPEDVAALQRAAEGARTVAPEHYLAFLRQFKTTYEALRLRPGPRGKRFTLP